MAGITVAELVAKKLRDRFGSPRELGEHADKNPLEVRVGGVVTLDTLGERDLFFNVKSIGHAVETIGTIRIPFTDYELVATPGGDDLRADGSGKVRRMLRVWAADEPDACLEYVMVMLADFYACDYEQAKAVNLHDVDFVPDGSPYPVLQDPLGEFNDFETGERYVRRFRGMAGWESPHVVTYTVLRDLDGNGRVDEGEVSGGRDVRFWDYERDETVGNGPATRKAYLFVEQDADGFFTLRKGREVPQEAVVRL